MQKIIETATQMEALQQIGFLWIHEISHVLREHSQRAAEGAVDPNIWNIAADMEINDSHWEGLEAPTLYPGIYPITFKMNPGELAETYYKKLTEKSEQEIQKGLAKAMDKILAEEQQEKEEQKEGADQEEENSDAPQHSETPQDGESGEGNPDSDSPETSDEKGEEQNSESDLDENKSTDANGPEDKKDNDNQGLEEENSESKGGGAGDNDGDSKPDDLEQEGSGVEKETDGDRNSNSNSNSDQRSDPYHELLDEGSGVHNVPRPWELESGDTEPQELDEIETEQIRIAVAKEMSEAQKAGLLPAGWERWVGNKLRPVVDWKKVLRHRVSRAINHSVGARIDYSFARPSRRQAVYQPLIPPALSGNLTGQIACVVDTSGSIDDVQLTRILSEVCGILEVFNTPVTIIPCDAKAYPPVLLTRSTDLRQITSMPGGGGTNMIRGIEAALKLKPVPDVVVVLTDGYTPYPERLYKTPVLFGIITNDLERTNMLPGSPWRDDLVVKILLK